MGGRSYHKKIYASRLRIATGGTSRNLDSLFLVIVSNARAMVLKRASRGLVSHLCFDGERDELWREL